MSSKPVPKRPPCLTPDEALVYALSPGECVAMWATMLRYAREDAVAWNPEVRYDAILWLRDRGKEVGGSDWVCSVTNTNYDAMMEAVAPGLKVPTQAEIRQWRRTGRRLMTLLQKRRARSRKKVAEERLTRGEANYIFAGQEEDTMATERSSRSAEAM